MKTKFALVKNFYTNLKHEAEPNIQCQLSIIGLIERQVMNSVEFRQKTIKDGEQKLKDCGLEQVSAGRRQ